MSSSDLVQLGSMITREQHAILKALSERTHIPMGVLVRQALEEYLELHSLDDIRALRLRRAEEGETAK